MIINGGLTTGLDEVLLLTIFANHLIQQPEKILMVKSKHYCFLQFHTTKDAQHAISTLSGTRMEDINKALYLESINASL